MGGQLLRAGAPVPLRPKTWAVLLHLAERPGVLVSRDDLLDAIWPEIAVTPDTINKSVGELRVALGDQKNAPRYIETVHGRGFRFIAATARGAAVQPEALYAAPPDQARPAIRPFVGRDEEIETLTRLLARAHDAERQMVFITGPAGVGKTTLIEGFAESPAIRQSTTPVWFARGTCIEQHGPREAYLPVLKALDRLARRPDSERLLELLRRVAPMWLAQIPWSIGEAEAGALRQSLQGVGAERMLREMAALLEELTANLTLVLVLEDLHWSDPATVDLLSLLGQRDDPARLLVIATYRPAEVAVGEHVLGTAVRALQLHRQCVDVPLHDLDEGAVRNYLSMRFPGSDFAAELGRLIHVHTGGQPLFVAAAGDHMLSRGWILDTDPGWALSVPLEGIDLGVPDDVRRMIEMQFEGLGPSERHLLQAASVADEQIVPALLAAGLECEVAEAELGCEELARLSRFLRVTGSEDWPDGSVTRYVFTHELHRQVVYEGIPEGRRARLHRHIGEGLEAAYGARAADVAPKLAFHFERARDPARLVRYLTAAGVRARQRFADREAIAYFEDALAESDLVPDEAGERHRRELDIRLAMGGALSDVHGYTAQEVRVNYERASELCAAVGDAGQLFDVLYARWYLHGVRADAGETAAILEQMEDLARRLNTAKHHVLLSSAKVRTAVWQGRFTDAKAPMELLLAQEPRRKRDSEPVAYGPDPVIAAAMHHAIALWFLGDPAGAFAAAHVPIARARKSGNVLFLCSALTQGALLHLLGRRAKEGGDLAEEVLALSSEHGFALWNGMALAVRGWAHVQSEEATEGCRDLERGLAGLQATGARFFLTYIHGFRAEGYLRAGKFGEGLAAAAAGLALSETASDRGYVPELWRLKGELLLAAPGRAPAKPGGRVVGRRDPNWRVAEKCLLRGLELARSSQAKSLELRASTSIARAWKARGRGAEARALLRRACGWFDRGEETADLAEARALLAELRRGAGGDSRRH